MESADTDRAPVTAHSSSPDRVVFVEEGNPDAWIATDLAVETTR
jgi:hypothetical protein